MLELSCLVVQNISFFWWYQLNSCCLLIRIATIRGTYRHVILFRREDYLRTNDNQFSFKPSHSTDLCAYALTELIDYFIPGR